MKNYLALLSFIILAFLFSGGSCAGDETDDNCDQNTRAQITRSFVILVDVKYKDDVPYQGNVDLSLFKEYCSGKISGEFHENGNTNSEGSWFSGMQFIYDLDNKYDKVDVTIKIKNAATSQEGIEHEVFMYDDIANLWNEVYKNYEITLPWTSEE